MFDWVMGGLGPLDWMTGEGWGRRWGLGGECAKSALCCCDGGRQGSLGEG